MILKPISNLNVDLYLFDSATDVNMGEFILTM